MDKAQLLNILDATSIITSGLFAGGAFFQLTVEHPTRNELPPQETRRYFQKEYEPSYRVNGRLALISAASSIAVAILGNGDPRAYYLNALALFGTIPYTKGLIMPTNNKLLSSEKLEDEEVQGLFSKWGNLHLGRVAIGLLGFGGLVAVKVWKK
jgi:hypothetical protein